MPPKGWRKNRNAKTGAEQWIKTPSSTTTKTVTIISKSPSHSIWDAFWPNFDKRRKARDTVKITGTYNPDTKTLDVRPHASDVTTRCITACSTPKLHQSRFFSFPKRLFITN